MIPTPPGKVDAGQQQLPDGSVSHRRSSENVHRHLVRATGPWLAYPAPCSELSSPDTGHGFPHIPSSSGRHHFGYASLLAQVVLLGLVSSHLPHTLFPHMAQLRVLFTLGSPNGPCLFLYSHSYLH